MTRIKNALIRNNDIVVMLLVVTGILLFVWSATSLFLPLEIRV